MTIWYVADDPAVQDALIAYSRFFNGSVLFLDKGTDGFHISHLASGLLVGSVAANTEMGALKYYWKGQFQVLSSDCRALKGWQNMLWRLVSPRFRRRCQRINMRLDRWLQWGEEHNLVEEIASE